MFFTRGFLFYAFFNVRLFLYLLSRKRIDVLVANDLDTLPANYLISKIRNTGLVYDSHEYFTESPELINRNFVKIFWKWMEKFLVPRLKYAFTVSQSIADEYYKEYGVRFMVIRNFPLHKAIESVGPLPFDAKGKKVLIYQGSVNIGRGLELIIQAVKEMEGVIFLIVGDGDIKPELENLVKLENLSEKVCFTGKIPFEHLHSLTVQVDGGLSFEEDMGLSYRFSLPNKLFDYIHAGIPVLVSSLPEMSAIVNEYNIGIVNNNRDIEIVKQNIHELLFDNDKRAIWKKNLVKASQELTWENEEKALMEIFAPLF